jgi:hypothetical protein
MQHKRGLCQSRSYAAEHAVPQPSRQPQQQLRLRLTAANLSLMFFVPEVIGQGTN